VIQQAQFSIALPKSFRERTLYRAADYPLLKIDVQSPIDHQLPGAVTNWSAQTCTAAFWRDDSRWARNQLTGWISLQMAAGSPLATNMEM
jgi:hypothetical protein